MQAYSLAIGITGTALQIALVSRATLGRLFSRFPLFYSYILFGLAGSLLSPLVYWREPHFYATFHWFHLLLGMLAEFAVVLEISDQIFDAFPAIRRLGQFITLSISAAFLLLYITPSLLQPRPSSVMLLDLALRISLTQGVIIAGLAAVVLHYRLRLGRNVGGLMLGFALYVGVGVVNYGAAAEFGRALYAQVLWFLQPLAFTLCLFVWTVALWEFAPVLPSSAKLGDSADETSEALDHALVRFNNALTDLLQK